MPVVPPGGTRVRYRQQYRRCGKAACTVCAHGGAGHGPYWYAVWYEGGRTHTRYLGKAPPASATAGTVVSAALADAGREAPDAWMRVQTLGGFAVWRDGVALPVESWGRHRAGALFKWLLAAPGQRLARDQAIELLWPLAPSSAGAANLRVLLHRLRRALGEQAESAGSAVAFDGELLMLLPGLPARAWLDAEAFAQAADAALAESDRAACRVALALYTGDYLPDDRYDEWSLSRRDELRAIQCRLLLHLSHLSQEAGDAEEAIACLHAVLAADRCHEEAALALMRLHRARGHTSAALRVYRQLAEGLREEIGVAPGRATRALAAALQEGQEVAFAAPAPAVPTNLPAEITGFVGRGSALAALRALLSPGLRAHGGAALDRPAPDGRLLTLVGPGGVGKTRLALALAADVLESYPDGVWLVDLSTLPASMRADDPLVAQMVATVLGVREEADRPLDATVAATLRARRLLLVLDNCEHVLPACAALTTSLLVACPALRVLATSRETLGIAGEQPWSVPGLSQPEMDAAPERLVEAESSRLFLTRARLQRPDLEVTQANAAAIAAICRQLDGLPLALELAAARTRVLSVDAIAARLGESLRLLTGGPRSAPGRQRSLRATLDWSYRLLSAEEQRFFRRLAVFAGGCTLEAAEALRDAADASGDPLDLLAGLADKSLIVVDTQGQEARYRLLETVRQYAWEQLAAVGEEPATQERHLRWYLALAEEGEEALQGSEQAAWLERLDREHDNLRRALHHAVSSGRYSAGLRLAAALWRFWYTRGYLSEGRGWIADLLARARGKSEEGHAHARAKALYAGGAMAFYHGDVEEAKSAFEASHLLFRAEDDKVSAAKALNGIATVARAQNDYVRARAVCEEGLELQRELGNKRGIAAALDILAELVRARGDYRHATALHQESLALFRELEDAQGVATVLYNLARLTLYQGAYQQASALYAESLALYRTLEDKQNIALVLHNQAGAALFQCEYAAARRLCEQSKALFEELNHRWGIAAVLNALGELAFAEGDTHEARVLAEESLALYRDVNFPLGIVAALNSLGDVIAAQADDCRALGLYVEALVYNLHMGDSLAITDSVERIASIFCVQKHASRGVAYLAAAAAARERMGTPHWLCARPAYQRTLAHARAVMGNTAFEEHWQGGSALLVEDVAQCIVAELAEK